MEINQKSERRASHNPEFRVVRDADGPTVIEGYSIVYDKWADLGWFQEVVRRGAATNALKKSDIRALVDHISYLIVGRVGVNLTLTEDDNGVFMRLVEPAVKSQRFEQLAADVESRLITSQSYAFSVSSSGQSWRKDQGEEFERREIVELDQIFDVSLVTYPAYPDTTAAKRSRDAAISEERYQKHGATPGYDEELELLTIITAEGL